jgi:3D (Asp-Asp-Asp) domain-containing protein
MKIKTNKLTLMLILIMLSITSASITQYKEKKKCIVDLKNEFKFMPQEEKKVAAEQIKINSEGVVYGKVFIPKTNNSGFKILTVRITVYWAKGSGTDYYSSKKKSSTGYTLKQGESIAVDPRIIPYKKEVIIPNVGVVKAVDTGSAVIAKSASHGKLPVIDVFFEHKKDAMLFASKYPKVVTVAILN